MSQVVLACLLVHVAIGALLIGWGSRLGRASFLVGALAPATTLGWTFAQLGHVLDGGVVTSHASWVSQLDLAIDLRFDAFAATMALIVAGIGVLVFIYCLGYFAPGTPDIGRLAGLLVLFAGAMLGLVLADNLLALYGFWEVTTVTSYLLIGNKHTDAEARAAALHALLVTAAGGLAMLGGFVVLGQRAGTFRFSEILAHPPGGAAVNVALVLVLLGAFTKSAQYPFHAWLPGAMAAPTPISTYLHSATMVKAGVYLIARLAPAFATVGFWRPLVLTVGCTSLVFGGLRALRQNDLKLLLAFGTVSQLGLLVVFFGAGVHELAVAGCVLLVAHALFKAALFMVVGILDTRAGTRDLRLLPPLDVRGPWGWVNGAAALAALSMAGVPLGLGFVAKEAGYDALVHEPFTGALVVLAATVAGSALTAAYAARFYAGGFLAPRSRRRMVSHPTAAPVTAPEWWFFAPAVLLAATGLVFGVAPQLLDPLVTEAARAIAQTAVPAVHLALWHGLTTALALSVLTLALGAALFVANPVVQGVLARGAGLPSSQRAYLRSLRGLRTLANGVTGVVQNGSLPVYTGVILFTAAALPAVALLAEREWQGWPTAVRDVATIPIAALLIGAAIAAAAARRRFSAAVFLGVAGYAMAALFVVHGAPDLALTQAAIETLSTVAFVLVLRRLPDRFERQSTPVRRIVRVAIAATVGATIFAFAIVAGMSRTATPVSVEMVARSVPDAHGRNVVNVILVDFRELDTMGEIMVLAAASIGAVALARAGRRGGHRERGAPAAHNSVERVVFVDVSARLIFHAVLMLSLWLLFAGHNQPGGGFVAGLLAGSAIALRYIAGGVDEVRALSRFRPWTVLGTGLLVAATTATFPLLLGDPVLRVLYRSVDLGVFGTVNLSSALLFDIGVYITVIGMVLMVFEAFGEDQAVPER